MHFTPPYQYSYHYDLNFYKNFFSVNLKSAFCSTHFSLKSFSIKGSLQLERQRHLWIVIPGLWTPAVAQEGAFAKWDAPLFICGESSAVGTPSVIGSWQSLWAKKDLVINHTTVFALLTLKTKETNRIISYEQQQSQAIKLPLVIPASTLITCGWIRTHLSLREL